MDCSAYIYLNVIVSRMSASSCSLYLNNDPLSPLNVSSCPFSQGMY